MHKIWIEAWGLFKNSHDFTSSSRWVPLAYFSHPRYTCLRWNFKQLYRVSIKSNETKYIEGTDKNSSKEYPCMNIDTLVPCVFHPGSIFLECYPRSSFASATVQWCCSFRTVFTIKRLPDPNQNCRRDRKEFQSCSRLVVDHETGMARYTVIVIPSFQ